MQVKENKFVICMIFLFQSSNILDSFFFFFFFVFFCFVFVLFLFFFDFFFLIFFFFFFFFLIFDFFFLIFFFFLFLFLLLPFSLFFRFSSSYFPSPFLLTDMRVNFLMLWSMNKGEMI